jgi:hypothetical protein
LVNANLALYAVETLFYVVKARILTSDNLKLLNRLELFSISGIVIGIWGLILINSDEINENVLSANDPQYLELHKVMLWMFFMRVLTLLTVTCLILCYLILITCLCCLGRRQESLSTTQHLSRLPLVNRFLSSKARTFDPSKDKDVECCAICMEDF